MAEFSYKWDLANIVQDKKHIKVFSCFSCGGGSTMGYKRAGFDVIGNVEIDPKINAMYVKNHQPKFNYCMDLRDFNKLKELPEELFFFRHFGWFSAVQHVFYGWVARTGME